MADLKNKYAIYLKGILFFGIVVLCATLLIIQSQAWLTVALVIGLIWASARSYYFMFYVIEKYVDNSYKFSGIYSFLLYCLGRRDNQKQGNDDDK